MWFLITFIVIGFLAGWIGRVLVRGSGISGFLRTTLVGMAGSFVGGFLGYVLFGHDLDEGALQVSGIVGSVLGSVLVLLAYRRQQRRRVRR